MDQIPSGYLCAGFETLATIMDSFMAGLYDRYDNHFQREDISAFNEKTVGGFLHSFGQNFVGRKKFNKYVASEAEVFKICRETGFYNNSKFYIDSGGFQASIGKIDVHETDILIDLYHQFLTDHHDLIDRAFVLDLPPGPVCKLFKTWDDVFQQNMKTYSMAANLPVEIRDKMIYIHHFRTPMQWKIFNRILREGEFFDKFKHHATGGIVANLASDMQTPCVLYCLPLVPLLNECKKAGRDYLNFHILGGANFRDILFYELFTIHVQEVHGIKVNFTYDSSGLFKGLMVGRNIHVTTGKTVKKLNLRTHKLQNRFHENYTSEEYFFKLMDDLAEKHGFKKLDTRKIYNEETGTFFNEVRVYAMMHMFDFYSQMQTKCREYAKDTYELYKNGNLEEFNRSIIEIILSFNGGKITKKQITKAVVVCNSLKILTHLDEDYCEYLVKSFLAKDEFTNLSKGGSGILQF